MLTYNPALETIMGSSVREPVFVAKINNQFKTIFLTSRDIVIPDAGDKFQGIISSSSGVSQEIEPEKGFSTVGEISIELIDQGFTELLNELKTISGTDERDSIFNNMVELFLGDISIPFSEYLALPPMYVDSYPKDELNYTLVLKDSQKFTNASLFEFRKKTKLEVGIGERGSAQDPEYITVKSTDGFNMVAHDDGWSDAPNKKVGYLKVEGKTANGFDAVEYIRYDQIVDGKKFRINGRGRFGTPTIDLLGSTQGVDVEVEECIYIDLPFAKMYIALMTGDLYGQAGETLPDHWHAAVDPSLIDIASVENIGGDLWTYNAEFIDPDKSNSKRFIADQILKISNTFSYVNQNGELALKRFSEVIKTTPSDLTINNNVVISSAQINNDASKIRNSFAIRWGYDPIKKEYRRSDGYIDGDSIEEYNTVSPPYEIKLQGIRNRDRYSSHMIDSFVRGMRSRFSSAPIVFELTCLLSGTYKLNVGDIVSVQLDNLPDENSVDGLEGSFEVQKISWDFLAGTSVLKLYGSTGTAGKLSLQNTDDAVEIDTTGWTDITTLTPSVGSVNIDGEFTFYNNTTVPDGRYFYNGDMLFDGSVASFLVNIEGSVYLLANGGVVKTLGDVKFDGAEKGYKATEGVFGGEDMSQEGVYGRRNEGILGFYERYVKRKPRDSGGLDAPLIPSKNPKLDSLVVSVNSSDGQILNLPSKLFGNGSAGGAVANVEYAEGDYTDKAGGEGATGGAGLAIIAEEIFLSSNTIFDTSGGNGFAGTVAEVDSNNSYKSGSSSGGWPGILMLLTTKTSSDLPLNVNHVAIRGSLGALGSMTYAPYSFDSINTRRADSPFGGYFGANGSFYKDYFASRIDLNQNGYNLTYNDFIGSQGVYEPIQNVDIVESAQPVVISLSEQVNIPRTPLGNQTTITATAIPAAGDSSFSHAIFEYRLKGQAQWIPINYGIREESTVTVVADGSSYEFRAVSVNKIGGQGGISLAEITVANVNKNPENSDGGSDTPPEDIQIPPVRRLELINRLNDAEGWDKFKSPNAEFRWAKLSTTSGGNIISVEGVTDLHLEGYKVRVFRNDGSLLREEIVKDSFYTYTFEKNKKDTNGFPVRDFKIDVQPIASTGYVVEPTEIAVSNPAPAAVTGITTEQVKDGVFVTYTPPNDVDFVGVKIRDVLYTGSSITIPPLSIRSESLSIVSVDQFGDGDSATVVVSNPAPAAVTGVVATQVKDGIQLSMDFPDDFDFLGVKVRGQLYDSNSFVIAPSATRTETLSIVSVDSLGDGDSATVVVSNPAPAAVTGVTQELSKEYLAFYFTPPNDVDYIGVKIDGIIYQGSSAVLPPFLSREKTYVLTSVDSLGDGSSTSVTLSNPAPAAPTGISYESNFTSITVRFTPDTSDYDLLGTNFRFRLTGGTWSGKLLSQANEINISNLPTGSTFEIELTSVDAAGEGGSTSINASTQTLNAASIDDLGNWADRIDPVDIDFINSNMDNDSLPSEKIKSLTAAKITAGQITVQVDIGTGVFLDGANGVIQTSNNGYKMTMGAVDVSTESSNELVLFASDGSNYPFWIDVTGSFKFGIGSSSIEYSSTNSKFTFNEDVKIIGSDHWGNTNFYYLNDCSNLSITSTGASNVYNSADDGFQAVFNQAGTYWWRTGRNVRISRSADFTYDGSRWKSKALFSINLWSVPSDDGSYYMMFGSNNNASPNLGTSTGYGILIEDKSIDSTNIQITPFYRRSGQSAITKGTTVTVPRSEFAGTGYKYLLEIDHPRLPGQLYRCDLKLTQTRGSSSVELINQSLDPINKIGDHGSFLFTSGADVKASTTQHQSVNIYEFLVLEY